MEQNIADGIRARELLATGEYTCVLCRGEDCFTTTLRGVKPLVSWLDSGMDLAGCSAADKVVGKATAYLYQLLGVKSVYAQVMSQGAAEVLAKAGIETSWDRLVPNIINRKGDGICPFELAVGHCAEPAEARATIYQKMEEMGISR